MSGRSGAIAEPGVPRVTLPSQPPDNEKKNLPILVITKVRQASGGNVEQQSADRQRMLRDALELLHIALDLLDRTGAPAHIGAHVDLAAHQLAETIDSVPEETALIAVGQSAAHH